MGEPEDSDLLAAMVRGDEGAFGILLDRYEKRLFNRFLMVFRNRDEAADLTQQAFLVLLRKPEAVRPEEGTVGTFLFGVARVLILKRLREMHRRPLSRVVEARAPDQGPLEDALRRERHEKVLEGIGTLGSVRRSVLLMREEEGVAVKEIARRMSLPEGTVKSHLMRARIELRRWLAPYLGRGGNS